MSDERPLPPMYFSLRTVQPFAEMSLREVEGEPGRGGGNRRGPQQDEDPHRAGAGRRHRVTAVVGQSGVACGIAHVFVRHTSCSVIIT